MSDDQVPSTEYEPLTAGDRESLGSRLADELLEVRARILDLEARSGERAEHDGAGQSRLEHQRAIQHLRVVSAALRRIRAGSYGECALCGGEIGRRLLLARPSTPYCRYCEEDGH